MNIKLLHSWLTKYLTTNATPTQIASCLSLCGPSVETVTKKGKDWLYDIEVTTNRVDMMSVHGIAREAAAILPNFGYEAKLKKLEIPQKTTKVKNPLPIDIICNESLNHRVMAVVIDNVKIANSPRWMSETLIANDIRSLNNIVDITNYVMMEVGHPCHVFNYDRIKDHHLKFRLSKAGEKVTTLDRKTYTLPGGDIVIENSDGEIIDLPGIMGTANSVVTDNTQKILFFINNNDAKKMRATSMATGIRTMAVTLDEKNVDQQLSAMALFRGLELYKTICHGKQASDIFDFYPHPYEPKTIDISLDYINDKIGVNLDPKFIKISLESLGFTLKTNSSKSQLPKSFIPNTKYLSSEVSECKVSPITKRVNQETKLGFIPYTVYRIPYTVTIPSWRNHDINLPIDIVEEIARIYGYHNLPSLLPSGNLPPVNPQFKQFNYEAKVKDMLKYLGFTENYNYSLISENLIEKLSENPKKYLQLKNPLSTDWLYMRKNIYPSLLNSLSENQNRAEEINLFELANIYQPQKNDLPHEIMTLSIVRNNGDFYDLKGIIEYMGSEFNLNLDFKANSADQTHPHLHSQIQTTIYCNNQKIGILGQTSQDLTQKFNLKTTTHLAEINFQSLVEQISQDKTFTPISKYPPIIENLTFINQHQVFFSQIISSTNTIDPLIKNIRLLDFYKNKLNLEITYQDPKKNLTDQDILPLRKKLAKAIESLGLKLEGKV